MLAGHDMEFKVNLSSPLSRGIPLNWATSAGLGCKSPDFGNLDDLKLKTRLISKKAYKTDLLKAICKMRNMRVAG